MREKVLEEFRDFLINDSEDNQHSIYDIVRKCWTNAYRYDEAGHIYVDIRKNDGTWTVKPLHNLLATAFLEKPEGDDLVVHHINGDASDNRLENLMWVTRPEHMRLHMLQNWTDEGYRTKMSEAISNSWTDERRQAQSEAMKGIPKSDETKQKMSEAKKGKFGKNNPTSKAVVQLTKDGEFVRKWDSMMDVSRELGYNNTHISKCCKGKLKSCSGYKWVYESDYKATISPIQLRIPFDEAI